MITATTEYNPKSLALMAKLSVRKYKVQCYVLSAVFLILGTVLNMLLIRQIWYELLVLLLCALYWLRPYAHRKKLLKGYLLRENEISSVPRTQRSEFGEEQIETRTLENGNTLAMKYSALTTIYETVDFLVLMTAGKQCLPLKKTAIENGTPQELVQLLQDKVPKIKHVRLK